MADAGNEDPVTGCSKQLRDVDVLHLLRERTARLLSRRARATATAMAAIRCSR